MRTYILLALAAAASAADFTADSKLGFTPGTDNVPTDCLANPAITSCVAKLASGNVLVPSFHQIIDENEPDRDATGASNGVSLGWQVPSFKELRTLAIIPDFPKSGEGKKCQIHFITNDGVNLASDSVPKFSVYSLKPGKIANLETTWNGRPERDVKVAQFDLTQKPRDITTKYDHIGVDGASFPSDKTFDCPKPGTHIAWELATDTEKSSIINKPLDSIGRLFVGGMLGLGVEIIGVKSGYTAGNATATPSPSASKSASASSSASKSSDGNSTATGGSKPTQATGGAGISGIPQNTNAGNSVVPGMGFAGVVMGVMYAIL